MSIAFVGQIQQRYNAEERPKLVQGSPFQEHKNF